MISKEDYVNNEVETSFEDHKFVAQILRDFYWKIVKDMTDKEFKEHLIVHGYEIEEYIDDWKQ